jgi:pseudouridine kinase
LTNREKEIYQLIKKNPFITQQALADQMGITRSSVGVHIRNLMSKGHIKGRGYILDEDDYVIVIGGSNVDLVGFSKDKIILEDSNPGRLKTSLGGVGRNIADNLARLDIKTQLLSAVGDDAQGQELIENSIKSGIDMRHVIRSKVYTTSTYLSVVDYDGNMVLALSDMESIKAIDIEYLEKHHKEISNAKAIVIDTNLTGESIAYIFDKYQNMPIYVDTVSTTKAMKILPYLENIHTLKPNRIEAEKLLGMTIQTEEDMRNAVQAFLEKGINQVVISNGGESIFYGDSHGIYKILPEPVKMMNANGAGDAFMAGLVYGYMNELMLKEAMEFAMVMSRLTLESNETISPMIIREKIIDLLEGV